MKKKSALAFSVIFLFLNNIAQSSQSQTCQSHANTIGTLTSLGAILACGLGAKWKYNQWYKQQFEDPIEKANKEYSDVFLYGSQTFQKIQMIKQQELHLPICASKGTKIDEQQIRQELFKAIKKRDAKISEIERKKSASAGWRGFLGGIGAAVVAFPMLIISCAAIDLYLNKQN